MRLIETHDPQMHSTPILDIVNGIHDPIMIFLIDLTRIVAHEGLDRLSHFSLSATSELLMSYFRTILKPNKIVRPENGGWLLNQTIASACTDHGSSASEREIELVRAERA